MPCNNPKLDNVPNLVKVHNFFLKISSLKRVFRSGGDKYCMQWDYSYRLSAALICFAHVAPRYAQPYVILHRDTKQIEAKHRRRTCPKRPVVCKCGVT